MRHLRLLMMGLTFFMLPLGLVSQTWALEEGELVRKDGQWQYLSS
jgi:hypothetical protein